jgi:hypothetical protein
MVCPAEGVHHRSREGGLGEFIGLLQARWQVVGHGVPGGPQRQDGGAEKKEGEASVSHRI